MAAPSRCRRPSDHRIRIHRPGACCQRFPARRKLNSCGSSRAGRWTGHFWMGNALFFSSVPGEDQQALRSARMFAEGADLFSRSITASRRAGSRADSWRALSGRIKSTGPIFEVNFTGTRRASPGVRPVGCLGRFVCKGRRLLALPKGRGRPPLLQCADFAGKHRESAFACLPAAALRAIFAVPSFSQFRPTISTARARAHCSAVPRSVGAVRTGRGSSR